MWVEVICWIDRVLTSKECVCFVCDPSVHLDVPTICCCMSEVISSFKSLRAGSQGFALLVLFRCVIVYTMWSGNSLQLLCHLWYIAFVFHRNDVCQYYIAVCMLVGIVIWAKTDSVLSVNGEQ